MRYAVVLAAMLVTPAVWAQDAFERQHAQALAKNAPGLSLSIRIADGAGPFRPGERIPVEMTFTAKEAGKYQVETHRLAWGYWIVDREEVVKRPGVECGMTGGVTSGLLASKLLDGPVIVKREVNDYLRLPSAGTFRFFVISYSLRERVRFDNEMRINPPRRFPTYRVVSNIATVTILPADPAWTSATITAATALLNNGAPDEKLEAARSLRFIGNEEAVNAMVAALGDGDNALDRELFAGLADSPHRKLAASLLERWFLAPHQRVSSRYVEWMVPLAQCAADPLPRLPIPLPDDEEQRTAFEQKRRELEPALLERGRQARELARRYYELLATSLDTKQGEARATTMITLLQHAQSVSYSGSPPPWLSRLRGGLAGVLPLMPAREKRTILEHNWDVIASPAMLPALRQIYDDPGPPVTDPPLGVLALRRIYELAPDEGRKLILKEIENPLLGQRADELLLSLPDATLPQMDHLFVGLLRPNPAIDARVDRPNPRSTKLLARYATPATLPEVKIIFERAPERFECDAGIVAYFLKHDQAYGEALAHRLLRERPFAGPGLCSRFFMEEVAKLAPREAVERVALAELDNPRVPAKIQAAKALAQAGSEAAEEPLWKAFEYWRKWWAGREREMNDENWQLEMAFQEALSHGRGWVLTPAKADRLERACVSASCRQTAASARHLFERPVQLTPARFPDGVGFWIDGGYRLKADEVREKLKQYPKEARFELRRQGNAELLRLCDELLAFARKEGIAIGVVANQNRP